MSLSLQRARPQTVDPVTSAAMARTDSKSPTEAIGNPASMISTPSPERALATSIFSAMFMLAPGDCSPSRRVVSKMRTRLGSASTGSDEAGDLVMARLFLLVWGGSQSQWAETQKPRDPPVEAGLGASLSAGRHGPDEP